MADPCQTTPGGAIFPGRPGESLAQYIARTTADFAAYMERCKPVHGAFQRPSERLGTSEYGR